MVRSVNIERTDRLVVEMIKDALRQIRERSPDPIEPDGSDQLAVNDPNQIAPEGLTHLSPDQLDLLSDAEKKTVITDLVTRISVHFDGSSNKHSVDIEFSETVSRLLAGPSDHSNDPEESGEPLGGQAQAMSHPAINNEGDSVGKKPLGSGGSPAAEFSHSVTVE